MKITIASGKGGTGKTTVAASLAISLAAEHSPIRRLFLDCDVEAPNAHLFLHPALTEHAGCGAADPGAWMKRNVPTAGSAPKSASTTPLRCWAKRHWYFPQLCHGCGSCTALCPEKAIHEVHDRIGVIERGLASDGHFLCPRRVGCRRANGRAGYPPTVGLGTARARADGSARRATRNFLPGGGGGARQRLPAAGD